MDNRKKGRELQETAWFRKQPLPVTPKILVKALKELKVTQMFDVFFGPVAVAHKIAENNPWVEQDFEMLLLEVRDKLICAVAADLIGFQLGSGYFPLSQKSEGMHIHSKSELTFWMMYKRILESRMRMEKLKRHGATSSNNSAFRKRLRRN